MTNQELNRDIKRLLKAIQKAHSNYDNDSMTYYRFIENDAKKEFTRLFYADKEFTAMTKSSILIMLRLNVRHRFIALHNFGININIDTY
jgi:hypothetical protein